MRTTQILIDLELDILDIGLRPTVQRADRHQLLPHVGNPAVGDRNRLRVDGIRERRRTGHVENVKILRQRMLRQLTVSVLYLEERRVRGNITRGVDHRALADSDAVARKKAFERVGCDLRFQKQQNAAAPTVVLQQYAFFRFRHLIRRTGEDYNCR